MVVQCYKLQVFHSGSVPGPDPLTQRIRRISLLLPVALSSPPSMWVFLGLERVLSNLSCHSSILWGCLWANRKTQTLCKQQNIVIQFSVLAAYAVCHVFFFFAAAKLQMFRNMIMLFAGMNVNVAIKKILDLPAETCIWVNLEIIWLLFSSYIFYYKLKTT